jgi:pilus assembly protein FimV
VRTSLKKQLAIRLSCQKTAAKSLVKIKLLGLAALMFSTATVAVGMGGINVSSGLGEKLKADIDLVAVAKAEKASLVARLASPDSYKNAGVEYPFNNKFRFEIANHADGEPYLKVTSDQPVNDPFVVMMVELNWASGRLVREYTFLLDPPNFVADQPATATVQPVAPVTQVVPVEAIATIEAAPVEAAAAVAPVEVVVEPAAPAPVEAKPKSTPAPATAGKFDIAGSKQAAPVKAATKSTTKVAGAADSYVVQRGDTLAKIAADEVQSGMSLERTLVALYRANVNEFDKQNMNRLSVGKTLHLPTEKEIAGVKQADAVTEIRAQAEDWNAYRQKLAGAATTSKQSSTATQQVATGKINSSVADKAPVVKQSATEVLKLSKGEAPGDKAAAGAGGKAAAAQDKKNAAKEEAIAQAKTLKEGQARAALLDKNLKDAEKLAKLKLEAAALAQKQAPVAKAAAVSAAVVPPKAVAEVAKPAADAMPKPKAAMPVAKTAPQPEPSLLDTVMSEPTYMAGAGAGLLGLLGLGWFAARRKKVPAFEDTTGSFPDLGSTTGHMAAAVAHSAETGDFTQEVTAKTQVVPQHDDVDPISEADLFLNFGRDSQAEDILKDALNNTPNNHQIHLKLLGIYAKRKDLTLFENIARQLQESGDEAAFTQASEMGRGIDPRNTLYGGSEALEDAFSATMQAPSFGTLKAVEVASEPAEVDFDLGAEPTGKFEPSPEQHFLDDSQKTMSMPIAAVVKSEVALPNLDEMIFDVTGSHPTMQMGKPSVEPEAAKIEDLGMEFTLDYPMDDTAAKAAPALAVPAMDLSGISFDLGDNKPTHEIAAQEKSELWHEVATKIDLAKAYQEMGDGVGAREILEEVLREGDAEQREIAQTLIDQIT